MQKGPGLTGPSAYSEEASYLGFFIVVSDIFMPVSCDIFIPVSAAGAGAIAGAGAADVESAAVLPVSFALHAAAILSTAATRAKRFISFS
jgi:hypothetical protein